MNVHQPLLLCAALSSPTNSFPTVQGLISFGGRVAMASKGGIAFGGAGATGSVLWRRALLLPLFLHIPLLSLARTLNSVLIHVFAFPLVR